MPRRPGPPRKQLPPLFKNKQWEHCYQDWLRSLQDRSGSADTVLSWKWLTRNFFTDHDRTPDKYTRAEVEVYIHRHVRHRGGVQADPKPHTQNARLTALRSFYAYASSYDVPFRAGVRPILHTPAPTRGIKIIKAGRMRRDLTTEELKRLFDAVPRDDIRGKRDYALFSCYFWTARRRSEVVRLRWGDISEVLFREENGQQRLGHMYRYTPKGKSREVHTAELRPEAWEPLVDYLKTSGRWEHLTPGSPLFVRHDNGKMPWMAEEPLNKHTTGEIIAKYRAMAGLPVESGRQICIHSFRHTRAHLQYRRDKDVMEIKKMLGHDSLETTMLYLIDDEQPDRGAQGLAAELGKL